MDGRLRDLHRNAMARTIESSPKSKSDIYRETIPLIASGGVELLDNKRLRTQLLSLERRISRGTGHESIDAPNGTPEDIANACSGACVYAASSNGYGESRWSAVAVPMFGGRRCVPDDNWLR